MVSTAQLTIKYYSFENCDWLDERTWIIMFPRNIFLFIFSQIFINYLLPFWLYFFDTEAELSDLKKKIDFLDFKRFLNEFF